MTTPGNCCPGALSFDAALAVLVAQATPIGIERVLGAKAGRRVLAAPVRARIDAPRQRVSAMDGYAVRRDDLDAGVSPFRLVGGNVAGGPAIDAIASGEAAYVATGAAVPQFAACIVPCEQVAATGSDIRLLRLFEKRHIRDRGSDFAVGDELVPAGQMVDPRTLVAIAAADVDDVEVWRRPRLCVVATGDELVAAGTAAETERSIPDSLSEALLLLARQWGAKPIGATRAHDEPMAILAATQSALAKADVVILVGGASRGRHDFSKSALAPLGLDLKVDTVAMRPGRPIWYGRIGAAHVIGLPGNPTAAMTVARLMLVPLLTALGGRGFAAALRWQSTATVGTIVANGPREAFLCGTRTGQGVAVIAGQTASAQMMLARADVLVRRAADAPELADGAFVQTLRF